MHVRGTNNDPDFPSAADVELHLFGCDAPKCDDTYEAEGSFSEVWEAAKKIGWRAQARAIAGSERSEWLHYCPRHANPLQRKQ